MSVREHDEQITTELQQLRKLIGKVKVSRDVSKNIDLLLESNSKENVLYLVANEGPHSVIKLVADAIVFLRKNTSPLKLAEMLINGYEVEQTPEEIIKEKYEELFDYEPIDRACKDSFRFVLDTLGIKIKGVNE